MFQDEEPHAEEGVDGEGDCEPADVHHLHRVAAGRTEQLPGSDSQARHGGRKQKSHPAEAVPPELPPARRVGEEQVGPHDEFL